MINNKKFIILIIFLFCFSLIGCDKDDITQSNNVINTNNDIESVTIPANKDLSENESDQKSNNNAALLETWVGEYTFAEYTPPDENMVYCISIYKEDDAYYADISIDGFQTIDRYKAKIVGDGNNIDLIFNCYLPDNMYEPYFDGDLLLSLKKENSTIYTYWEMIKPMLKSNNKSGQVYFNVEARTKDTSEITIHSNAKTNINEKIKTDKSIILISPEPKKVQPIEDKDFIVTDEFNAISLDTPYLDFKTDKEEKIMDDNYVGEIIVGDYMYKNYIHEFEDFNIYVSNTNYNTKNRNYDEYYITQITLKTPVFKTARGLAVGANIDDIIKLYGDGKEIDSDGNISVEYILDDKILSFNMDEEQKVKSIIFYIITNDKTKDYSINENKETVLNTMLTSIKNKDVKSFKELVLPEGILVVRSFCSGYGTRGKEIIMNVKSDDIDEGITFPVDGEVPIDMSFLFVDSSEMNSNDITKENITNVNIDLSAISSTDSVWDIVAVS